MNDFSEQVINIPIGKTYLFSIGQAGYIIKSQSGQLMGIDMYLSDCVERIEGNKGFKRLLPKILGPEELVFDVIVATHEHRDHFDVDSISELLKNEKTNFFASLNCENDIRTRGVLSKNCNYVKPGDQYTVGDFQLEFVNCNHGESAPDAVGVLITVDGKNILEIGDTSLCLNFVEEYQKKGQIDVLIAPINGEFGNLNEKDCVKLAKEVNPKLTIPCHYGMFAAHGGNIKKFCELMQKEMLEYLLMCQGECYDLL